MYKCNKYYTLYFRRHISKDYYPLYKFLNSLETTHYNFSSNRFSFEK